MDVTAPAAAETAAPQLTPNYFARPASPPVLHAAHAQTALASYAPAQLPHVWFVIEHCCRTRSVGDAAALFERHFAADDAAALTRLLVDDLNGGMLAPGNKWGPPRFEYAVEDCPQFSRRALFLTREKFAYFKSVLQAVLADARALADLNALLPLRHNANFNIAVAYACFDLRCALPAALDRRLFWSLLDDLLDVGAARDLSIWRGDGLPALPEAPALGAGLPDAVLPASFVPHEPSDPLGHMRQLWGALRPDSRTALTRAADARAALDVFVAVDESGCGSGGAFCAPGTREVAGFAMHRAVCVPPRGTPLPRLGVREARAALDAATCWAPLWAGHAVRFHVRSAALHARLVDGVPPAEQWPEVHLLHAMGHRWNFSVDAADANAAAAAGDGRVAQARAYAHMQSVSFAGAARCVEAVDALAMDIFAERLSAHPPDEWFRAFARLHLELDARCLGPGAATPGALYHNMRTRQRKAHESGVGKPPRAPDMRERLNLVGFDTPRQRALWDSACRRAFHREREVMDALWRDELVPVRARALADAALDPPCAIGARLTYEPELECRPEEAQRLLLQMWMHQGVLVEESGETLECTLSDVRLCELPERPIVVWNGVLEAHF